MLNVTCAIILKDGNVLATQRSESMPLPLKWEFPGGKLEKGEDEIDCITREILEELNIHIRIIEKFEVSEHDYGNFKIRLIPFLCEYQHGDLILSEHLQYLWCIPKDLDRLDWAEADIPIVKQVIERLI